MDNFQIRTDLALEARESVNEEESKLRGVSVEEHYEEEADLRITKVTIDTKNAEKMLGKPMGVYVTMEAPAMVEPDDDCHREISEALAEELLKMNGENVLQESKKKSALRVFAEQFADLLVIILIIAAIISILIKEALYRLTLYVGKKENSQAVIANAWHHRSEAQGIRCGRSPCWL